VESSQGPDHCLGFMLQVVAARLFALRRGLQLRSLAKRLLEIGLLTGSVIGGLLIMARDVLPRLFVSEVEAQALMSRLFVTIGFQMPLVALTLIFEGFLVGCGRFAYLGLASTLTSAGCACALLWLQRMPWATVVDVWMAIKGLFVARLAMAGLALLTGNSVFKMRPEVKPKAEEPQSDSELKALPPL
jgi:Na+-driven multidrug efflux pump